MPINPLRAALWAERQIPWFGYTLASSSMPSSPPPSQETIPMIIPNRIPTQSCSTRLRIMQRLRCSRGFAETPFRTIWIALVPAPTATAVFPVRSPSVITSPPNSILLPSACSTRPARLRNRRMSFGLTARRAPATSGERLPAAEAGSWLSGRSISSRALIFAARSIRSS